MYTNHVTESEGQTVLSALERSHVLDTEEAKGRYSPGN